MTATHLTVLGHGSVIGSCDLCAQANAELTDTVSVRRDGRTIAVLAACERCGRAARRLAALIGPAETTLSADMPVAVVDVPDIEPHLMHEFIEHIVGGGREYTVRAYAAERSEDTWVGWLTFTDATRSEMRSTGVETTQSTRQALTYWATGLEPAYLEGAFARATSVHSPLSMGTA